MINFFPHLQQIAINLLPISIIYQLLFSYRTHRDTKVNGQKKWESIE